MTLAKFLFVCVDKFCDRSQNNKKMLRYDGVPFEIETDIAYGEGKMEKLDIYRVKRESGEKYPVFFYIHGGGFVAGDKVYRRGLSRWAANLGFFVVNVNYALGPEEHFPLGIQQLIRALNWVGENAEKYNLDLDNMCVSGDSAGGYYSAMLACVANHKELQDRFGVHTSLRFRAALLNCGIYDINEALSKKLPFKLTDKVLYDFSGIHVKGLETYEYSDVLAPLSFVDANFPVSFITYAEKDIFCKGQGQKLIKKLEEVGVHVEHDHSTKLTDNHCYPLSWTTKAAKKNVALVENFLGRVIRKEV